MLQVTTKILDRHGYVVDPSTFEEMGAGEWVTWACEKNTEDMYLLIGYDERFVVLNNAQALKYWLVKNG